MLEMGRHKMRIITVGYPPLIVSSCLFDDTTRDLISEAFPLHIRTLQVTKDWKWGRHRNESIYPP